MFGLWNPNKDGSTEMNKKLRASKHVRLEFTQEGKRFTLRRHPGWEFRTIFALPFDDIKGMVSRVSGELFFPDGWCEIVSFQEAVAQIAHSEGLLPLGILTEVDIRIKDVSRN